MDDRRERLAGARLYLVCDPRPDEFLLATLRGGVDIVQLRAKSLARGELLDAARRFAARCREHGALFIVNDDPQLAAECGADGVHVGQDDVPVERAREIVGTRRLVGLSTHSPAQLARCAGADYVGVGPVHATPTKPGRAAVGLGFVRHAARHAPVPFFAIGGIDAANVGEVVVAGARRVAVVRALCQAADPEAAARELRSVLDAAWERPLAAEVGVGAAR